MNLEQIEVEIDLITQYLSFLYAKRTHLIDIRKGQEASAEILTEQFIQRIKDDTNPA